MEQAIKGLEQINVYLLLLARNIKKGKGVSNAEEN